MSDTSSRLKTIDGLRGIAALAVVVFHLGEASRVSYGDWVPAWVAWTIHQGSLGVDVFFVLSGFVIAYSVRSATYTVGFLGSFAVRRLVRLDPPYWVAIVLETALIWLSLKIVAAKVALPSVSQTVAHLAYMQHFLGLGDIVPVFWTLCFEVQFYLFLIGMLVLGTAVRRYTSTDYLAFAAFTAFYVLSLVMRYQLIELRVPGLALVRWYQFFLGVLVWWVVAGKARARTLLGAWVLLVAAILWSGASPLETLPVAISGLLWWSYRRDRMASMLSWGPWQFLGAISYSLYLFHSSIGWRLVRAPDIFFGVAPAWWGVLIIYIGAILGAVGCSWVAWRYCERPFQRLSRSVGRPERAMTVERALPQQPGQSGSVSVH
jgi:peptidoglycan/LPS O-acetylase OafA/YrhL